MYKGISGLGLPYVIIYGADMLFESMCDKVVSKTLLDTSKAMIEANSTKDKKTQTVAGGKLIGTLFNFQTNFKSSLAARLIGKIQTKSIGGDLKSKLLAIKGKSR